MNKLLIGTNNPGKLKEIKSFLKDVPIQVLSLDDVGINEDVEETGKTYEENSLIKAKFFAEKSGFPSLSDDGGLEIAHLNNEPGIHSKRWIGNDATEDDLVNHMMKVSSELPDNNRKAWFKVALTVALPDGEYYQGRGEVEGIIAKEPNLKQLKGYPYRSFFYIPEIDKFYHELDLSMEEKERYNHRYKAIQKLLPVLKDL